MADGAQLGSGIRRLRVLVACEFSGTVRDAFISVGHDAMSCDLLPTERPGPHYHGDVRDIIWDAWDLLIAHPPCTYLSSSGLHWNTRGRTVDGRPRAHLTDEAVEFARLFIETASHIPMRAVENPIGCLSTRIREPDQIIQPWQYGEDASKATCLWLSGLPSLKPRAFHPPRLVVHKDKWAMRWSNQTDSGQNTLGPSDDRWAERSKTYVGIAEAMASQWGQLPAREAA
jgi:hypothetical protein